MGSRRNRYLTLDQRTGRLERAISLVNDGQIPSIRTTRAEADRYHPQSRPLRVPMDRVVINGTSWITEPVRGPTNILVGYLPGASSGTNWERPGIPSMILQSQGGFVTTAGAVFGFGEYAFGQYGFGGDLVDGTEDIDF